MSDIFWCSWQHRFLIEVTVRGSDDELILVDGQNPSVVVEMLDKKRCFFPDETAGSVQEVLRHNFKESMRKTKSRVTWAT